MSLPDKIEAQVEELREKIESLTEDIFETGFESNGDFPTERRGKWHIIKSYTDDLMSLFTHQLELAKIEAKIEQSYRCQELIEANRDSNEDGERYGEIVLLDVDDLQDELSELTKQKEELNERN